MGMYSVPLYTNKPDAVVNLKRLREFRGGLFTFSFLCRNVEVLEGDSTDLATFLLCCEGKLYAYLDGRMALQWDIIASCMSEAASLYFHYEEGAVFRIDCDPNVRRLMDGLYETVYRGNGKAQWFITQPPPKSTLSTHSMKTRSGRGWNVDDAVPLFSLPSQAEINKRESFFHTPRINLRHFYACDVRGELAWRRVDSDLLSAWW